MTTTTLALTAAAPHALLNQTGLVLGLPVSDTDVETDL